MMTIRNLDMCRYNFADYLMLYLTINCAPKIHHNTTQVLIDRLINRSLYWLAFEICKYMNLTQSHAANRVFVHWASQLVWYGMVWYGMVWRNIVKFLIIDNSYMVLVKYYMNLSFHAFYWTYATQVSKSDVDDDVIAETIIAKIGDTKGTIPILLCRA